MEKNTIKVFGANSVLGRVAAGVATGVAALGVAVKTADASTALPLPVRPTESTVTNFLNPFLGGAIQKESTNTSFVKIDPKTGELSIDREKALKLLDKDIMPDDEMQMLMHIYFYDLKTQRIYLARINKLIQAEQKKKDLQGELVPKGAVQKIVESVPADNQGLGDIEVPPEPEPLTEAEKAALSKKPIDELPELPKKEVDEIEKQTYSEVTDKPATSIIGGLKHFLSEHNDHVVGFKPHTVRNISFEDKRNEKPVYFLEEPGDLTAGMFFYKYMPRVLMFKDYGIGVRAVTVGRYQVLPEVGEKYPVKNYISLRVTSPRNPLGTEMRFELPNEQLILGTNNIDGYTGKSKNREILILDLK